MHRPIHSRWCCSVVCAVPQERMASNELLEPHSTQKIVLLGASDVGKSSLVLRFVKGKFFDRRENTIGAAFLTKTITLDEIRLKFEIWDTAGQERYHSLAPMYYRDAAGSLVVYDINDKESFEKAKRWLNELYKAGSSNMVIVLVGNKHDLPEREVDFEEGQKFAEEHGLAFFETSAKTNHNVEEVFDVLGRQLLEKNPPTDEKEDDDLIQIGGKSHSQQSDKGCPC